MSKPYTYIASGAIIAGVIVVTAAVSPWLLPDYELNNQMTAEEAAAITQEMINTKCADCHKPGMEVPQLLNTLSGGLLQRDVTNGLRSFNIDDEITEVTIAKLEHVLNTNSMPPTAFTMVHWGSFMTPREKVAMGKWTANMRKHFYPSSFACPDFVNEAIQPIPDNLPVNPAKVALGEKLFHDVRLSNDNTVSCATCHALDKAGTDNLATSTGVKGQKGGINAPTVFNAAFHHRQFWDGRAKDLQEQAGGPPLNPVEMGYSHESDWKEISAKLEADPTLAAEFKAVYPDGFNAKNITEAIAEFEKTLITPNSPFDRYLKGDANAISDNAKKGYALFKKNGCQMCHVGVAMGGLSFEAADRRGDFFGGRALTGDDNGRMNFTKDKADQFKFRVPTLRNVALTWPYLHDASAKTLSEAVDKMLVTQCGVKDPKKQDIDLIVDFLETLTGNYQGAPVKGEPAKR